MQYKDANFTDLLGKTLSGVEVREDQILFRTNDGSYIMHHVQDCCEDVRVEGCLEELEHDLVMMIGHEILQAEMSSNEKDVEWGVQEWTFYKLRTVISDVTIRWLGESNGYYSTQVNFSRVFS